MITFDKRTKREQELIGKAWDFEVEAIRTKSSASNPYLKELLKMEEGEIVLEAIEEAMETWYAE